MANVQVSPESFTTKPTFFRKVEVTMKHQPKEKKPAAAKKPAKPRAPKAAKATPAPEVAS